MNYNYIGLLGYILLSFCYIYYINVNINNNKPNLIIIGSVLISVGYILLSYEKYNEINKKEIKDKEIKKTNKKGHLLLTIFYILSFLFLINNHKKPTDIFALGAHYLLIKESKITHIGLILMIIYYVLYCIRNSKHTSMINNIQVLGSVLLLYYYIKELKEKLESNELNKKLESKEKK